MNKIFDVLEFLLAWVVVFNVMTFLLSVASLPFVSPWYPIVSTIGFDVILGLFLYRFYRKWFR